MAGTAITKDTGTSPPWYAGPAMQPQHPGVQYFNHRFSMTTEAQVIFRGPVDPVGTRFVQGLFFKNWTVLDAETDPTVIRIRLVTVPDDIMTSDNQYPADYVGLPEEDIDEFGICQGATEKWSACFCPFYLKGNQCIVAYADNNADIRGLVMYSEEM